MQTAFKPFVYRCPGLPDPDDGDILPWRTAPPRVPGLERDVHLLGRLLEAVGQAERLKMPALLYDAVQDIPLPWRARIIDALAVTHPDVAALLREQLARMGAL